MFLTKKAEMDYQTGGNTGQSAFRFQPIMSFCNSEFICERLGIALASSAASRR
jgi:hypothetical protein